MARLALPLAVVLSTWLIPHFAEAQNRVVVQNFRGPRSAAIRAGAVRGLLGQDVAVVPRSDLARTARRMRLRMRGDRDFARAGRAMHADLFVTGRVQRRGGWHVSLDIRDGQTGQIIAQPRISARNPRALRSRVRQTVWTEISDQLGGPSAGPATASGADMVFDLQEADVAAMDDEAPPPADGPSDPEARIQSVNDELEDIRRRNLDGELYPTGGAAVDDEVIPAMQEDSFEPRYSPVEAQVGLLLLNRNFSYQNDSSAEPRGPTPCRSAQPSAWGRPITPGHTSRTASWRTSV